MSVYKSISVTKQLSNDKITFISFCCKYIVVWSQTETIAVTVETIAVAENYTKLLYLLY